MTPEALSREGSPAPPTMLGLPQTATMAGGEITLHAAPAVVEEVTTTAGGPHFLGKTLEVKTTNFTGEKSCFPSPFWLFSFGETCWTIYYEKGFNRNR